MKRFLFRLKLYMLYDLTWAAAKLVGKQAPIEEADREWARGIIGKRLTVLLLVSIICSAYPLLAQNYSLELGAALYGSTAPHSAGYLTVLLGDAKTRSYTTIELRGVESIAPTHSTRTGIERTLFKDERFELTAGTQVGISTGNVTSGVFLGNGSLIWSPKFAKGLRFAFGGETLTSPDGWQLQFRTGMRYNFGK